MKTLFVLGAGRNQVPLIERGKQMGLRVVTADPSADSPGFAFADEYFVIDLADRRRLLDIAKANRIDGVMTIAADYPVPAVAYLCESLSLPGISTRTAEVATNKHAMRAALMAAGVPVPWSIRLGEPDEAADVLRDKRGPVILKPCLSSGGRGITLLHADCNGQGVREALQHATSHSRDGHALIEEYVEGPEVSVETLTQKGRTHVVAVTDKMTSGPPHFVEVGHSIPSMLEAPHLTAVTSFAVAAVEAIGIAEGPSHTEIRVGRAGPRVIEIGARLGGGFITSHLVPLATGVDMLGLCISVALGDRVQMLDPRRSAAAIRFVTALEGVVKSVCGVEGARSVSGVHYADIYVEPGDPVRPLRENGARIGHVIAQSAEPATAMGLCEDALRLIDVQVQPVQAACA